MKGNQSVRVIRDSVVKKISKLNHVSEQKVKETILPHFQSLFRNDSRFACRLIRLLDLSESEAKYLLGEKYLHKMKDILQCAEKTDEKQGEIEISSAEEKSDEKEKKESGDLKQPSIFDF
jgi:hypothetical protein